MQIRIILTLAVTFAFAACAPSGAAGPKLSGTQWWLKEMPGWEMATAPQVPTLVFHSDKQAGGRSGCNTWGGGYELKGDRLRFGEMRATLMACAYGMEVERLYLNMLEQVRRVRIEGETLTLANDAGADLARFTRASTAVPP